MAARRALVIMSGSEEGFGQESNEPCVQERSLAVARSVGQGHLRHSQADELCAQSTFLPLRLLVGFYGVRHSA